MPPLPPLLTLPDHVAGLPAADFQERGRALAPTRGPRENSDGTSAWRRTSVKTRNGLSEERPPAAQDDTVGSRTRSASSLDAGAQNRQPGFRSFSSSKADGGRSTVQDEVTAEGLFRASSGSITQSEASAEIPLRAPSRLPSAASDLDQVQPVHPSRAHYAASSAGMSSIRRSQLGSLIWNCSAQEYIERKYGIAPPTDSADVRPPTPPAEIERIIREPLDEDELEVFLNAKVWAPNAYWQSGKGSCRSCAQPINDTDVAFKAEAVDSIFHASCFRCDQCDVLLDEHTLFTLRGGKIICRSKCAASVSRSPETSPASTSDGRSKNREREPTFSRATQYPQKAPHEILIRGRLRRTAVPFCGGHEQHEQSVYPSAVISEFLLPRCRGCGKAIDGEAACALDGKWHPGCFGCEVCRQPFPDKSFYVLGNSALCRRHYHERNNSICRGCGEPIEGTCAQVQHGHGLGEKGVTNGIQRYHPTCFCCAECGCQLTDMYFNYRGGQYCERHVAGTQRGRNAGVASGNTKYSVVALGR